MINDTEFRRILGLDLVGDLTKELKEEQFRNNIKIKLNGLYDEPVQI
jgi:hypothetical protein